ncbi:hypothetical protein O6H91_06G025200 [Diphasiastrum complanatum]|uniref:Uncharacterized protein n=1 Tax=Diphasiastrum complanatum TaxID=34168 RepID=A0ACC2DBU0_DIPCM|nr:hypothetical protein O6H91_06G025200 [Diphasiastrum complanatum]
MKRYHHAKDMRKQLASLDTLSLYQSGSDRIDEEIMEIGPVRNGNEDGELSTSKGYIEHHVSKLDTLPGIAIKYGVEVADIKRINGLASDFQMYARSVLQIPLPGRHPPSESLPPTSKSHKRSEPRSRLGKQFYPSFYTAKNKTSASVSAGSDGRDIDRRKVTSSMGLLRGYYGLSTSGKSESNGMEILYRSDAGAHSEDEPFTPPSNSRACKSRQFTFLNGDSFQSSGWVGQQETNQQIDDTWTSLALDNGSSSSNMLSHEVNTSARHPRAPKIDRASEKVVRRRTKVEGGDNNESTAWQDSGPGDSSLASGKNPAPKPKPFRTGSETESDVSAISLLSFTSPFAWASSGGTPMMQSDNESKGLGGALLGGMAVEDLISKIRRSASTSNIQDEKISYGNSTYKSGSTELLDASDQGPLLNITRPFLEGLVKPGNRRNKAALD